MRSAESSRSSTCHFADKVADASINEFRKVCPENLSYQQTVIASVVLLTTVGTEPSFRVVALGVGTKYLSHRAYETHSFSGQQIRDCHAEVLARRAFLKFLQDQVYRSFDEWLRPSKYEIKYRKSIFSLGQNGLLVIKPGHSFHFYSSSQPCGNATIKRWAKSKSSEFFNTPVQTVPSELLCHQRLLVTARQEGEVLILLKRDCSGTRKLNLPEDAGGYKTAEHLRIEMSSSDNIMKNEMSPAISPTTPVICPPGTATVDSGEGFLMTCSDKMAKWNAIGVQGALLSNFFEPVYMASVTVGRKYSRRHCERALCCRIQDFMFPHPAAGSVKSSGDRRRGQRLDRRHAAALPTETTVPMAGGHNQEGVDDCPLLDSLQLLLQHEVPSADEALAVSRGAVVVACDETATCAPASRDAAAPAAPAAPASTACVDAAKGADNSSPGGVVAAIAPSYVTAEEVSQSFLSDASAASCGVVQKTFQPCRVVYKTQHPAMMCSGVKLDPGIIITDARLLTADANPPAGEKAAQAVQADVAFRQESEVAGALNSLPRIGERCVGDAATQGAHAPIATERYRTQTSDFTAIVGPVGVGAVDKWTGESLEAAAAVHPRSSSGATSKAAVGASFEERRCLCWWRSWAVAPESACAGPVAAEAAGAVGISHEDTDGTLLIIDSSTGLDATIEKSNAIVSRRGEHDHQQNISDTAATAAAAGGAAAAGAQGSLASRSEGVVTGSTTKADHQQQWHRQGCKTRAAGMAVAPVSSSALLVAYSELVERCQQLYLISIAQRREATTTTATATATSADEAQTNRQHGTDERGKATGFFSPLSGETASTARYEEGLDSTLASASTVSAINDVDTSLPAADHTAPEMIGSHRDFMEPVFMSVDVKLLQALIANPDCERAAYKSMGTGAAHYCAAKESLLGDPLLLGGWVKKRRTNRSVL